MTYADVYYCPSQCWDEDTYSMIEGSEYAAAERYIGYNIGQSGG